VNKQKSMVYVALNFAWHLGYTIVVPLLVLALGGRYLDLKFDSSPLLFLVGIVLSVIVTSIWLVVKMSQFTKTISQDEPEEAQKL